MNNSTFVGRITKDPSLKKVNIGGVETSVLNFYIAVDESHGEYNKTEFVYVTVWRGLADAIAKYMKQGDIIGVIGATHTKTYVDREGKVQTTLAVPRPYFTEFLGKKMANDAPDVEIPTDNDCPFDD